MKSIDDFINEALPNVRELFPWDLEEKINSDAELLLLDIREPYEFHAMHIQGALHVPRGILESSCEYNYEDTIPELVQARERDVILVCRSGNRSVLAAYTMQLMGYTQVASMKTGLRGWNDYELPLVNLGGEVMDPDTVEELMDVGFRSARLTAP